MARRRNKKQEDFLAYPVTPDRQLIHPSGWCMTSDHDGCKYQFDHGKCGCDCGHKGRQKDNSSEKQDPRPWKQK